MGKVDIRELTPCSFDEYFQAIDPSLHRYVKNLPLEPLPEAFCNKLSGYLLEYYIVDGLPAALSKFIETRDYNIADQELDSILQAYEADFSRHIAVKDIPKLSLIWHSIPAQFTKENRRFIYGKVRQGPEPRIWKTHCNGFSMHQWSEKSKQ